MKTNHCRSTLGIFRLAAVETTTSYAGNDQPGTGAPLIIHLVVPLVYSRISEIE